MTKKYSYSIFYLQQLMNNTSKSILNTKFPNGVYAKGHNKYTSIYGNPRCHSEYLVYINEKRSFYDHISGLFNNLLTGFKRKR